MIYYFYNMEYIKSEDNILLLGSTEVVDKIKKVPGVNVTCLNSVNEFLSQNGTNLKQKFDVVLSYMKTDSRTTSAEVLFHLQNVMKPNGKLIFYYTCSDTAYVISDLKIHGFTKVSVKPVLDGCYEFYSEKPSFEIGSSVKISLPVNDKVSNVWKLEDSDDEVINDDELLDEEDLKKPDPSSLRVCGTTGKRKACKDCSCGLAEELKSETLDLATQDVTPMPKSSCGSCYLGDAFRCATCPYLGMPAFKLGEKIKLSDIQLEPDI